MKNVFLRFCELTYQALNKAWTEGELKISNMYWIKNLFYSEEEMEEEVENARIEKRIYKWLQNDPENRGIDRRPREKDWLNIAENIDKLTADSSIFKNILYEAVGRAENSVPYINFTNKINIGKFRSELENYIVMDIGQELIADSSSFGSKVAVFFIHNFMGKKVLENIPCSIQTNYYIERENMEKLVQDCLDRKFIYVEGETYSGKTTLLVQCAKRRKIKMVCCTGARSYQDVLESIIIEEDVYLDSKKKRKLGYLLGADCIEIKEKRMDQLEESFWLVIDKFQGKQKNCKKLEELSKREKISIFLEPVIPFPFLQNKPKICIDPLTTNEIRQLFYLMKNKYDGNGKVINSDVQDKLLEEVQKAVCDNPALVILIAEYYWGMQANGKITKSKADSFLEDIASQRNVEGDKYYSILNNDKSTGKRTQKQHDILGHIRHLFDQYVPTEEKNVFYVLYLISSIDVEIEYIEKWFGISRDVLGGLEWKGWCCIDQEKLRVGIPQIIVHALKKDIFKEAKSVEPFRTYIGRMTETIMGREIQPVEVGMMQKIMLCLHNELLHKIQEKPSRLDETVCEFHFACINHFLNYGNASEAKSLMDETFNYEGVKRCKGSSEYLKILKKKREYMIRNDISSGLNDMMELISNVNIYQSAYGIRALFELVELYIHKLFAVSSMIRLESDIKLKKYRNQMKEYQDLYVKLDDLWRGIAKNPEQGSYEVVLYQKIFEYAGFISCNTEYLQKVCGDEKKYLYILQEIQGDNDWICDREKELMVRTLFLQLYVQFYMDEMKSDRYSKKYANELKDVITDRLDKILYLKNRMGELPINLADLYYAAVILACLILDRKKEAKIQKEDYSHVNFDNLELSKQLTDAIRKFNYKIECNDL